MYHRVLVAVDGSDAGRSGEAFAWRVARQFEADTHVVPIDRPHGRRGAAALAGTIAVEASRFGADVIVLGLDRDRIRHHRLSRGVQEELARTTSLPVLVAPRPEAASAPAVRERTAREGEHHGDALVEEIHV